MCPSPRLSFVLLPVILLGCGTKKQRDEVAVGSASGAPAMTADASTAVTTDTVEIFVDAVSVGKVTRAQLDGWPRVDTLVPVEARRLGTWMNVKLIGRAPTATDLAKPSASHPDKVPVLFPGEGGAPSFGMFDPVELAKKGQPAVREDGVREVRISLSTSERGGDHQGGAGEGADPMKIIVKIKTPSGDKELTGEKILSLPREPQPGNEETKGWRVTQFLDAVGVTKYQSLVLIDAGGTTLPLDKKELDPATANPFIKLNKQGHLRFRMFTKQRDGWQPGADLRQLVTIQVK
ncbi:MAG: hypothetical protein H0T89_06425 [Deltaproteobacteria bacterium]|nr:hypothetical protein [Deltaproteobacteria bacterium]MDQ3295336.1 hypothetical protein [Myxococcota bacterium]